ncbi:MAG: NotI family restriction endonuclease [Chlorobiaceae bacterium]
MFINKDLLEFFGSMMEIKKQKRDIFNSLAADVDDSDIKKTLLRIGMDEQRHVDHLQQSIDLVNGVGFLGSTSSAQPAILQTTVLPPDNVEQKPAVQVEENPPLVNTIPSRDTIAHFQPVIAPTILPHTDKEEQEHVDKLPPIITLVTDVQTPDSNIQLQSTTLQTDHSMNTFKHPLGEVFGFTATDQSPKAQRYRSHRHCPFNNKVPNCTNDQLKNPLGVCSILHSDKPVITCPVRFHEDWMITDDAADFFFEEGTRWSSLTEVHLSDANGKSAGNIDVMLVAYNEQGKIIDFGAVEIHAAYSSGNLREPFEYYMQDPKSNALMDWTAQPNYPKPDFLSAVRKSLVPQLLFKGGILNSWNKKMAVAIDKSLFDTLPSMISVNKEDADIAWFIYNLELITEGDKDRYQLKKTDVVYTRFEPTLAAITAISAGSVGDFVKYIPELAS